MKFEHCEFKEECNNYREMFCFNEYKDVCSTRTALLLSKISTKLKEAK